MTVQIVSPEKAVEVFTIENDMLHTRIAELTAHNAAMQEDAVHNTVTIKMLMAQLAEQVEENRGMRIQLGWSPK